MDLKQKTDYQLKTMLSEINLDIVRLNRLRKEYMREYIKRHGHISDDTYYSPLSTSETKKLYNYLQRESEPSDTIAFIDQLLRERTK